MKSGDRHVCWAVTVPGLEPLAARELADLGIAARAEEAGGVRFEATREQLFRANLHLRTVSRVLERVAEFRATAFYELEKRARAVRWQDFAQPGTAVEVRVTCKKSRLYHSDAVAQRVLDAISRAVPGVTVAGSSDDEDDREGASRQLFLVRFVRDVCTISADSSGELLHRRGYRLATAKAPIRETLAAAMLLSLGYDGSAPVVDPMCGSGTIPIEAALIARRVAPGLGRAFACERWPATKSAAFDVLRDAARSAALPRAPAKIVGSDRDAGAIAAAVSNAARAAVSSDVELVSRPVSAIEAAAGPGLVLVNPPYGDRIGDAGALRDLYAQLGNVARARCPGWTLAMVSADPGLERHVGLPFSEVLRFRNGGIPVRLVRARVPA
jgi:putative N6-adenine-specific DNA methylase